MPVSPVVFLIIAVNLSMINDAIDLKLDYGVNQFITNEFGEIGLIVYNSKISRFIFLLVVLLQHMGGFYSFKALLTFGMSGKPNEGLET